MVEIQSSTYTDESNKLIYKASVSVSKSRSCIDSVFGEERNRRQINYNRLY